MDRSYGTTSTAGAANYSIGKDNAVHSGISARIIAFRSFIDILGSLGNTADRIAGRIAGTEGEAKQEGGKPSPVPNGLGDEMGEIIDAIQARISRIERSLERTESALG